MAKEHNEHGAQTTAAGEYGQFGDIGLEIAGYARELINCFTSEPEVLVTENRDMPESDCIALGYWLALEDMVPLMEVPHEVDEATRKQAHDALRAFHVALPFNEAEREWLIQIRKRLSQPTISDTPRLLAQYEDRITMAGLQRGVTGRDLMHRWVIWRREVDAFAGQGSLDQAREALRNMRELLS